MAGDTSLISGVKRGEVGKNFLDKSGRRDKIKNALHVDSSSGKAVKKKKSAPVDLSATRTKALKKVIADVRRQANDIFSLLNEKSALVESASSVNNQQLDSARKIKKLARKKAPREMITRERNLFKKLQQIGEELELEIVYHNLESRADKQLSIRSGSETKANFEINAVEYRATSGDISSINALKETIGALKENRTSLKEQENEFKATRRVAKNVARTTIQEMDTFSENAIKSVKEAQLAAQDLAERISSGELDLPDTHSGLELNNSVFNSLFEEQSN